MFKVPCVVCGKECPVYGKDKTGKLPVAYCGKVCETNDKYDKRFDKRFSK
jgi:hypothetical protein